MEDTHKFESEIKLIEEDKTLTDEQKADLINWLFIEYNETLNNDRRRD